MRRSREPGRDTLPRGACTRVTRDGFSIVELLVALILFGFAVTGLAGISMLLVQQTTWSAMKTRRAQAEVAVVERLRSLPYDSLRSGSDSVHGYLATWTPTATTTGSAVMVRIVTTGPGYRSSGIGLPVPVADAVDTLEYRILEP